MGALLALIPTKDLVYGALIAILLAFGIYERHHLITEGATHELAALKASSDRLEKKSAAETAELQAKATMAEQTHDKEILALSNLPPVQPVRLCIAPSSGSAGVQQTSGAKPGDASVGAGTSTVQSMSTGDSSGGTGRAGPDIGPMLSALAARADQTSATLREYQSR